MTLTLHIAGQTLLSQLKVLNISISVAIEEEIIDSYLYEFLIKVLERYNTMSAQRKN